ncbi:MAG: AMIN domain-containing protein [Nitrosomonadales bacterium]|nr:AMIN domain-containing protein [Nitrosomonadales bacterium]MBT3918738.1 AMIN domain-containing protein [Nitrosomonadales bacterium]MBT4182680.1 AMIN domain-containing protein [Nitrosomonadales bacterium]MBT4571454.1 AMIN domain-containing protein [Nitrosomonadales bacterium]MBT6602829.1 AMIN domain-containing protein [Nitrosomonadales bacterium]
MQRLDLKNYFLFILLLFISFNSFSANEVKATRLWPAPDYTRITIESTSKINNDQMMLQNPERIVIDLKGISMNKALKNLATKVKPNDPNILNIRVGQFTPKVSRIVIDLKNSARVKIFSLPPVKPYQDRLVIDVYPAEKDDLTNLLNKIETKKIVEKQKVPLIKEKAKKKKQVVVAIDAGHGGEDPGAIGKKGTKEKKIVLQIAKKLKGLINADPTMKAYLVRDSDYFIPLKKRVSKARKVKADIFVSIHADAFRKRNVSGSSVFALSERGATSAFAKFIANKENEADLIGGVSIDDKDPVLAKTLLDLSQSATINDSLKLANYVLKEIKKVNNLHKQHPEQAGFAVLKAPDIPSILVETAFLSNPREERQLRSSKFQKKLAKAIYLGTKNYIKSGVSIASTNDPEN